MLAQHLSLVLIFIVCTLFQSRLLSLSIRFLFKGLVGWYLSSAYLLCGACRLVDSISGNRILGGCALVGRRIRECWCIGLGGLGDGRFGFSQGRIANGKVGVGRPLVLGFELFALLMSVLSLRKTRDYDLLVPWPIWRENVTLNSDHYSTSIFIWYQRIFYFPLKVPLLS